jgi:hypothetical protein
MSLYAGQFMMKFSRWLSDTFSWQRLSASLMAGFSLGFFAYILYLQTPVFSRRSLFFGIAFAIAASGITYFLLRRHPFAFRNGFFISWRPLLFACLLFFLALPSYLLWPPYPELPFFQRESTLVISVRTGAEPVAWSEFRRIYLNSGVEKLGFRGFQISGQWISQGEDYILKPESAAQIIWQGRVGRRASFALPIPSEQLEITTVWDGEVREAPVDKSPYVRNKNFTPPVWYAGLIYTIAWIPLFFSVVLMDGFPWVRRVALPVLILILAFLQTDLQFQMLEEEFHRPLQEAIETVQLSRHYAVLSGSAPNPWQYRVFSEWILESFIYISSKVLRLENAVHTSLCSLRVLQNSILLAFAYLYFVRLGITRTMSVYGVFLLAGGMLHVFYQSDLSFNTYFDVIFFLLGGILMLEAKYGWVPVLMVPAALNRETSVLIPILLIAWGLWGKREDRPRALVAGGLGLLVWALVFVVLRLYYSDAPMFRVGDELLPGWELFRYNLTIPEMPILLFQTLGFLPVVGLLAHRYWSPFVRIGFLLLVPAWILVHTFSSVWAETRLFLVPVAMVFVPAVLPFVDRALQAIRQPAVTENSIARERILTR